MVDCIVHSTVDCITHSGASCTALCIGSWITPSIGALHRALQHTVHRTSHRASRACEQLRRAIGLHWLHHEAERQIARVEGEDGRQALNAYMYM